MIENPETQSKNESNLNLSNKKTQSKSNISYPNLKNGEKNNVRCPIDTVFTALPPFFFFFLSG